jgi:hypothetical protein
MACSGPLRPSRLLCPQKAKGPYFDNMVDMYGKEAASEMMKKTIGPTSANYYQALMKAIGLWDTFFVTQDQFRSLGQRVPDGLHPSVGYARKRGADMKCLVTFRLKPGITEQEYEEWFRAENVPAVEKTKSILSYRVWRIVGVLDGAPNFDYLEEMEIDDRGRFERDIEQVPEMVAMLDGWYSRVADQVVVYGEEVPQD